MKDQISVSYKFNDLPTTDQAFVKDIVEKNIEGKMDSYLKKVVKNNPDAKIRIDYTVKFHEVSKKYDADFIFTYDWEDFIYKKEGFKVLSDLVNHAFQHFKEKLSKSEKLSKKERTIKKERIIKQDKKIK